MRLTGKEYWQSVYSDLLNNRVEADKANSSRNLLKKIIGKSALDYWRRNASRGYADYLLWDCIYKKYLPNSKGLKILEIGSAPGNNLVRFNREFGFIPYGVEYTENGSELNRQAFIAGGINPDNVVCADFFNEEFLNKYNNFFDIVISYGFIEHFDTPEQVINKHIGLLANGGYLIVVIPNFSGLNYFFAKLFNPAILPLHNLKIMKKNIFCALFSDKTLTPLICNYYGMFSFDLFDSGKKGFSHFLLGICKNIQCLVNLFLRIFFKDRPLENGWFSPFMIYIGVKK